MNKKYKKFLRKVEKLGLIILRNELMCYHTSFKIGGPADFFVVVNKRESLLELLFIINELNIPKFFIGNGSNILVKDSGFRGVVIKLGDDFKSVNVFGSSESKVKVWCGAAVLNYDFCKFSRENSLSGVEFLYGIPGTIGGAIKMNAGAFQSEIKDIFTSCECLDENRNLFILNKEQANFSYRRSVFFEKNDAVIISAIFELEKAEKTEIESKMNNFFRHRKETQPLNFPNAGSIFKRPTKSFASKLIDECGLKGLTIGKACVSSKHAGFIVNLGGASSNDVLEIIKRVESEVFKKTGIALELEIEIL